MKAKTNKPFVKVLQQLSGVLFVSILIPNTSLMMVMGGYPIGVMVMIVLAWLIIFLEFLEKFIKINRDYRFFKKFQVKVRTELPTGEILLPGSFIDIPVENGRKIVRISELTKKSLKRIARENNL